jgi:hypothetical protein
MVTSCASWLYFARSLFAAIALLSRAMSAEAVVTYSECLWSTVAPSVPSPTVKTQSSDGGILGGEGQGEGF